MVGALGVTSDGTKVPLGVVEGSTENATVVRGLVSDLRDRGLTAEHGILFVLDGGKALRRAVTDVYGDRALVQRCRIHKERNILDHLPSREHAWVRAKLHRAWANPDAGGPGTCGCAGPPPACSPPKNSSAGSAATPNSPRCAPRCTRSSATRPVNHGQHQRLRLCSQWRSPRNSTVIGTSSYKSGRVADEQARDARR